MSTPGNLTNTNHALIGCTIKLCAQSLCNSKVCVIIATLTAGLAPPTAAFTSLCALSGVTHKRRFCVVILSIDHINTMLTRASATWTNATSPSMS